MNRPTKTPSRAPAHDPIRPLRPARGLALAGLSLSMLLSSLGTSIAHVALPTLSASFGASFQEVQWVVLAYLLAITSFIVSAGRLGDVLGRRRLLSLGLGLFAVASLLGGLAPTLWLLILARAAQGLGAAMMMSLTLAFVGDVMPAAKTGQAMGLIGTTSAIGTALGPSLGGALIQLFDWRAIFLFNVPLALLGALLVHRHLPPDAHLVVGKRSRFDRLGTLLLVLSLGAYALAMTLGRGRFGWVNSALLLLSGLGVWLFAWVERRAEAPLLPLATLREPALLGSLLASALVATVVMASLVVGPFYLSLALGLEAGHVGLVMSSGPAVAALVGVPAGRVVDRFGPERASLVGLVGMALGALVFALGREQLGLLGYLAPVALMTGSYALFQTANNTSVLRDVGARERGVVSGTLNLSRNLGLITGASAMGAVFAFAAGQGELGSAPPAAIASAARFTFAVASALIGVAIVALVGARLSKRRLAPGVVAVGLALSLWPRVASAEPESSLHALGLLQPRFDYAWRDGEAAGSELSLQRARIGARGSVLDPNFRYLFVADFAPPGPRLTFLSGDYTFIEGWLSVRVGQFKRPFSRSFLTMASELSLIDRPATVGPKAFGDNADIGAVLHNGTAARFEYALGVFSGAGPNTLDEAPHPLLAARVGFHTKAAKKTYSESDLEGGPPRVGVGGAALVDLDGDGDRQSFVSGVIDSSFKAHGFAVSAQGHVGSRQQGPRWGDQRLSGLGYDLQIGYVIASRVEPVVRLDRWWSRAATAQAESGGPDDEAVAWASQDQHDLSGGVNVFFWGHALKWQNVLTHRWTRADAGHEASGRHRELRLQSQATLAF